MNVPENAVAVIGLAGRFPGANDVAQFWRNIRAGVTSITRFSDAELEDSFGADIRHNPNFVRARPILKDVDKFDAEFFGMLPREAALTDPQHRLMLECAWTALEDAGYDPATYPGSIGVFAGSSMNTYLLTNVLAERLNADDFASDYQVGSYDALLGALSDTLATRIAYKLNLRGPAMTVQSACSTSLLAIAQACQSLLLYQSDMALAGGVSITFPQKRGYMHLEGGMVSPDGICRPFDVNAGGTIFGDGAAVVLLKRLGEAIDDGDHIYAVIRGSAINNDGSDKVGFTAPSVRGQSEVIASAIATADVEPGTIGYVECHGTATPLGDPIEFDGLVRGFGLHEVDRPSCALGSVKANIGHLDAAAGVTGLIKAVMTLQHREIPPLTNFTQPNRHIDLAGSPFYFPTSLANWTSGRTPRRAGVSSFGVGGTNVHVILEEAPAPTAERPVNLRRHRHLLPLSARNDAALAETAAAIADHLAATPESALEDVAHTLQVGRHAFDRRIAIAAGSREEAIQALRTPPPAIKATGRAPLIFMFPGQGAQHAGMAHDLHRDHALFRELTDQGIAIASPIVGPELKAQLLDPTAASGDATLFAQPAPLHLRVRAGTALHVLGLRARRHGGTQCRRVRRRVPQRRLLVRRGLPAGRHARPHHAGNAAGRHAGRAFARSCPESRTGRRARHRRDQRAVALRRFRPAAGNRRPQRAARRAGRHDPAPRGLTRLPFTRSRPCPRRHRTRGCGHDVGSASARLRVERHRQVDRCRASERSEILGSPWPRTRALCRCVDHRGTRGRALPARGRTRPQSLGAGSTNRRSPQAARHRGKPPRSRKRRPRRRSGGPLECRLRA
jgi:acyl transferase domain-containing protein